MKKPLVSVMIPTYKRPAYCEQAVRSALEQDYSSLEVIVCDNSPDEETADALAQFAADRRFCYVRNREARTKADNFAPFERLAQVLREGQDLQEIPESAILPERLLETWQQLRQDGSEVKADKEQRSIRNFLRETVQA